jgi:hypothetical protein
VPDSGRGEEAAIFGSRFFFTAASGGRPEFAATFNRAGSSNPAEVRMKVRQAYEGRVIEARSSELKNGGWDCEFSIEEHETTGVTETAFYVPESFPTAEAAIEVAVKAGQQKIDSGFEYKSVVEYRQ